MRIANRRRNMAAAAGAWGDGCSWPRADRGGQLPRSGTRRPGGRSVFPRRRGGAWRFGTAVLGGTRRRESTAAASALCRHAPAPAGPAVTARAPTTAPPTDFALRPAYGIVMVARRAGRWGWVTARRRRRLGRVHSHCRGRHDGGPSIGGARGGDDADRNRLLCRTGPTGCGTPTRRRRTLVLLRRSARSLRGRPSNV